MSRFIKILLYSFFTTLSCICGEIQEFEVRMSGLESRRLIERC